MKVMINQSFVIDTENMDDGDMEVLIDKSIDYEQIDDRFISITEQKIVLDEEDMNNVLSILFFANQEDKKLTLEMYDWGRYDLVFKDFEQTIKHDGSIRM